MAVNLNPTIRYKVQPLFSRPDQFRRRERAKTSKMHRKVKLKFGHVLLGFLCAGGFFLGLQQAWLYVITCHELQIKNVEIACRDTRIQSDLKAYMDGRNLGNIVLLNMQRLKQTVITHPRIKDARIRKLFPSSLKISIEERIPAAVIQKNGYALIDREGVILEESDDRLSPELPLLTDDGSFQGPSAHKLELAWQCLEELDPEIRRQVEILDFSRIHNVTVKLRGHSVFLILGDKDFSQKIRTYLDNLSLFAQYSEMKSIDLRFEDRFILTPWNHAAGVHRAGVLKEGS